MKKFRLIVTEKATFYREVMLEVPDQITEDELEIMLDKADRYGMTGGYPDYLYSLKEDGLNIKRRDDDYGSPDIHTAETWDYRLMD